jgi:hypothetical protein
LAHSGGQALASNSAANKTILANCFFEISPIPLKPKFSLQPDYLIEFWPLLGVQISL